MCIIDSKRSLHISQQSHGGYPADGLLTHPVGVTGWATLTLLNSEITGRAHPAADRTSIRGGELETDPLLHPQEISTVSRAATMLDPASHSHQQFFCITIASESRGHYPVVQ